MSRPVSPQPPAVNHHANVCCRGGGGGAVCLQTTLLHFWEKTSHTMAAIHESFRGCQQSSSSSLKVRGLPALQAAVCFHFPVEPGALASTEQPLSSPAVPPGAKPEAVLQEEGEDEEQSEAQRRSPRRTVRQDIVFGSSCVEAEVFHSAR